MVGSLRWAQKKDIAPTEMAGSQQRVGEVANSPPPSGLRAEKAMGGHILAYLGCGVGRAGAQAGDLHREKVVDVVAEEAGVHEGNGQLRRKVTQGPGLVPCALDDVMQVHLCGVAVHQG